jgi:DNA-binding protein YbaB
MPRSTSPTKAKPNAPSEETVPAPSSVLVEMQRDLDASIFRGSAASGMVTADVRGPGHIVALDIDQAFMDRSGNRVVAAAVLEAIADGARQAEANVRQKLRSLGIIIDPSLRAQEHVEGSH